MAGTIVNVCIYSMSERSTCITTLDDRFGDRRPTLVQRLLYI